MPAQANQRKEERMTWVKPEFQVVELGMEVTAYVYTA